ncbi:metal ABC transporter permease [Sediminispirochaeta bajacaliforniensis]|uniref:metal ABC transporter permease n=1 Tax=Sediminispirochaeta bajacaliforniensis TaxID=148 RepID=UPI00035CB40A|nr:metal ABC transporter permease [Sediminispirochaeta bajacaliforniensis]
MDTLIQVFGDFTLRTVALGAALIGITSGALGCFALLRKQSLLGDSISHAALPGIVLAFMVTGSKNPLVLLVGAAIAGWIATTCILAVIRNTRIVSDGAQGVVLSVFFGIGLLLLTFIQSRPDAAQAGLDKYLFGQAAALLPADVKTTAFFGGIALILMMLFWKELKLMTFDPVFGESIGFSGKLLDFIITGLIVIAIVTGLQTVGVILMSSMLIAPAAAARQWTNKLGHMVLLSAFFGALAGVIGALLSSLVSDLPTGPTIVLVLTALVLISLLFAPDRGFVSQIARRYQNRFSFSLHRLLLDLYHLEQQHGKDRRAHDQRTIAMIRRRKGTIRVALKALQSRGWVEEQSKRLWNLTPKGREEAEALEKGVTT